MLTKLKRILDKPYALLFLSGVLLNIPFFFPIYYAELASIIGIEAQDSPISFLFLLVELSAFVCIAPAFYAIKQLQNSWPKRYLGGLIFFGSWMIPTSYWYFFFMSWWQAILALTFFTLVANSLSTPWFWRKGGLLLDYAGIVVIWVSLVLLRTTVPGMIDWWIPHIGYTQWQNLSVMHIANFSGIYGVIAFILIINALLAYLWIKHKKTTAYAVIGALFVFVFFGNTVLKHKASQEPNQFSFVAVQAYPEGGYTADTTKNDVEYLKEVTMQTLEEEGLPIANRKTFVVWPENEINYKKYSADLATFAKKNNIFLTYDAAIESGAGDPYDVVTTIDNNGNEILQNKKIHAAPTEDITEAEDEHNSVLVNSTAITSSVCYDLHYADISDRAAGNDLLLAPVDDDRYGTFQAYLHTRDIIYRSIENNIAIVAASTTGPTLYVNSYGMIRKGPLPAYTDGVMVVR